MSDSPEELVDSDEPAARSTASAGEGAFARSASRPGAASSAAPSAHESAESDEPAEPAEPAESEEDGKPQTMTADARDSAAEEAVEDEAPSAEDPAADEKASAAEDADAEAPTAEEMAADSADGEAPDAGSTDQVAGEPDGADPGSCADEPSSPPREASAEDRGDRSEDRDEDAAADEAGSPEPAGGEPAAAETAPGSTPGEEPAAGSPEDDESAATAAGDEPSPAAEPSDDHAETSPQEPAASTERRMPESARQWYAEVREDARETSPSAEEEPAERPAGEIAEQGDAAETDSPRPASPTPPQWPAPSASPAARPLPVWPPPRTAQRASQPARPAEPDTEPAEGAERPAEAEHRPAADASRVVEERPSDTSDASASPEQEAPRDTPRPRAAARPEAERSGADGAAERPHGEDAAPPAQTGRDRRPSVPSAEHRETAARPDTGREVEREPRPTRHDGEAWPAVADAGAPPAHGPSGPPTRPEPPVPATARRPGDRPRQTGDPAAGHAGPAAESPAATPEAERDEAADGAARQAEGVRALEALALPPATVERPAPPVPFGREPRRPPLADSEPAGELEPYRGPAVAGGPPAGIVRPAPLGPAPVEPDAAGPGLLEPAPLDSVVEPEREGRGRRRALIVTALLAVLLAVAVTVQLVRPVPEPALKLALPPTYTFEGSSPVLPMPAQGQVVLHVEGLGTIGSAGPQTPIPTASVAKVMTAYVFLKNHPLRPGEEGPTFTISAQEAARLPQRKQRGESHVDVVAGQRFTERKALEALMVVSANNIAHELARWDAGSIPAFVEKMNATARELGMTNTRYTDPSGYDSGTVSTAADQIKLLRAAMKLPAFAEVVAQRTYVPNDGGPVRPAGNVLLGQLGIFGGKTGYTDAAGGNFVFMARRPVGGVNTLILGAVMGQSGASAMAAMSVTRRVLASAQSALRTVTLVKAGERVGTVDDGLGGRTPVTAATPVTLVGWPGLTVRVGIEGDPPHRAPRGTEVGEVVVGEGEGAARFPVEVPQDLREPDLIARLTRLE